jgi:lipoprotein-anchoring transpeptidase ErfK/SrfK
MIFARLSASLTALLLLLSLRPSASAGTEIIVSVPEQRLVILENGLRVGQFPVSTSKFGIGDRPRSYATPLGTLQVASKTGAGAPVGAVFKGKRRTGEILRPNSRGRDPIVTRILHLRGLERGNSRAYSRGIYIHGTAEERKIGRPASYGCIRMKSRDVIRVFERVPVGAIVEIVNVTLHRALREVAGARRLAELRGRG